MVNFSILFSFGNKGQENVFYDVLDQKNVFLSYKNKKFKKSKNCFFFHLVSPWFWPKIGHFSIFFFKDNIGQENVFYDILEKEHAFLGYKNTKLKRSKNWDFSKVVNPWFWSKLTIFPSFFFRQYRPGKCVLRYSRTKKHLSRL